MPTSLKPSLLSQRSGLMNARLPAHRHGEVTAESAVNSPPPRDLCRVDEKRFVIDIDWEANTIAINAFKPAFVANDDFIETFTHIMCEIQLYAPKTMRINVLYAYYEEIAVFVIKLCRRKAVTLRLL